MQVALSEHCGEQDVVTRMNEFSKSKDADEYLQIFRNDEGYSNHLSTEQIKEKVGEEIWNSYYKFTIVRNPWDMVVSRYFQQKALPGRLFNILKINNKPWKFPKSLPDCLKNYKERWLNNQHYFDKNGEPICDFYIRYENLEEDYKKVCEHLGMPYKKLPRLKTEIRNDRSHYSTFYNGETKKIVENMFKRQIEAFGYKFEKIPSL